MIIIFSGLSKYKTKPVVYQDVFLACDLDTLEQLKELSSKRKAIEDSLNGSSSATDAIAKEISGGLASHYEQDIQKLECYLPLLENLVHNITQNAKSSKLSHWTKDLKLRWSSVLAPPFSFQTFYGFKQIEFELGMNLFLYAGLLHERAIEVLSSDLVQSATLLRKAAGIYKYLFKKVVSKIIGPVTQTHPPETMRSLCEIMSLICLAEAQAVTARKAEENGNTGVLVSKLHSGVKEFLVEAINIFDEYFDRFGLSFPFLDYIYSCKTLHELMGYKYHVESLKKDGKIGVAIGVLRRALANLEYTPKEKSWRLVYKQMVDELKELLRKYEYENKNVWYEKIPSSDDDLPLPRAVRIVHPIPYEPQKSEKKLVFKL